MAEFQIDLQNPIQQVIIIVVFGFLIGVFIENWMKWIAWVGGFGLWGYYNFIRNTTGAIKKK